jgi:hypothetical protein
MYREYPDESQVLLVVLAFWRFVAESTFYEDKFSEARDQGIAISERLISAGYSQKRREYILSTAAFYRSLLDYKQTRIILSHYLERETRLTKRLAVSSFWLDVVSHSIHWQYRKDETLIRDAESAYHLYNNWLDFEGKKQENLDEDNSAIRHLQWLRCGVFCGQVNVGTREWVERIYRRVRFGGVVIEHSFIDEIIKLADENDEVAQILVASGPEKAIEPVRWREVSTWLSAMYGDTDHGRQATLKFREITHWLFGRNFEFEIEYKRSGTRQSIAIAELNIAHSLLDFPKGSVERLDGVHRVKTIVHFRKLPWRYCLKAIERLDSDELST